MFVLLLLRKQRVNQNKQFTKLEVAKKAINVSKFCSQSDTNVNSVTSYSDAVRHGRNSRQKTVGCGGAQKSEKQPKAATSLVGDGDQKKQQSNVVSSLVCNGATASVNVNIGSQRTDGDPLDNEIESEPIKANEQQNC